jgi:hypothetical protein
MITTAHFLVSSNRQAAGFAASFLMTIFLVPDVQAENTEEQWSVTVSPFTQHFSHNPNHRPVFLLGVEYQTAQQALRGGAVFSNSFGQSSLYVFPWGGRYDEVLGVKGLYAKWTAGLLYGYKPPYHKKVPLNYNGFSPSIVPAVGYELSQRLSMEAHMLGAAAVMFTVTYRLP